MSAAHAKRSGRNIQIPTKEITSSTLQTNTQLSLSFPITAKPLFARLKSYHAKQRQLLKVASVGDTVYLRYGTEVQSYELVAGSRASHAKQSLPVSSPLGSSVIGKIAGEQITVDTEYGHFSFVISHIE
jgi:hypothetical protein